MTLWTRPMIPSRSGRTHLAHKPIIDVNPRRSVEMQEALKREKKARRTLGLVFPEERRYVERSGSERVNPTLKFGGRHVRVLYPASGMSLTATTHRRRSSPAGRTSRKTVLPIGGNPTMVAISHAPTSLLAWVFLRRAESIRVLQAALQSMGMSPFWAVSRQFSHAVRRCIVPTLATAVALAIRPRQQQGPRVAMLVVYRCQDG